MSADRELLEAAAKAEGHAYPWVLSAGFGERPWNPLTDDGDALRLGAALGMALQYRRVVGSKAGEVAVTIGKHHAVEGYSDDYMAATRLAITRAAAAIGCAA